MRHKSEISSNWAPWGFRVLVAGVAGIMVTGTCAGIGLASPQGSQIKSSSGGKSSKSTQTRSNSATSQSVGLVNLSELHEHGRNVPLHPSAFAASATGQIKLMLTKTSSGQFMPNVGHKLAALSAALRAGPEAVVEMAATGADSGAVVRYELRNVNGVLQLRRDNRDVVVEVNFQNPAFMNVWNRLASDVRWAIISGSHEHATLWDTFPHLPRDLNSLQEIEYAAEADPGEPRDAPGVLPWDATPVAKALFRDAQLRKKLVEPNLVFDYREDDLATVFNDPNARFVDTSVAKLRKELKGNTEDEAQGIAKINDPRSPRYLNVVTVAGQVAFYDAEGNLLSPSLLERVPLQYLRTAGRRTFQGAVSERGYLERIPYGKEVERLTPVEAARLIYTGHVGDVVKVSFDALPVSGPPRSVRVSRNGLFQDFRSW